MAWLLLSCAHHTSPSWGHHPHCPLSCQSSHCVLIGGTETFSSFLLLPNVCFPKYFSILQSDSDCEHHFLFMVVGPVGEMLKTRQRGRWEYQLSSHHKSYMSPWTLRKESDRIWLVSSSLCYQTPGKIISFNDYWCLKPAVIGWDLLRWTEKRLHLMHNFWRINLWALTQICFVCFLQMISYFLDY